VFDSHEIAIQTSMYKQITGQKKGNWLANLSLSCIILPGHAALLTEYWRSDGKQTHSKILYGIHCLAPKHGCAPVDILEFDILQLTAFLGVGQLYPGVSIHRR
jgi:hypothetical protein